MVTPTLHGRGAELAVLARVIDDGGTLVVVGDPGIGKSALLAAAGDLIADRGLQLLTATGVQSEAELPFAALHQLLVPLLERVDELEATFREALLAAFGLRDAPPPDLFLIALAAEHLVTRAVSASGPVALLVDDVHWMDPQSQEVIAFIARRGEEHGIVVIASLRTGVHSPILEANLPELEVIGLDDAAASELLAVHGAALSASDRHRIQREAVGNPLALLELPRVHRVAPASHEDLAVRDLPTRLEHAFAGRTAELPPATRDALLVVAASPETASAEIAAATSVLRGEIVGADVLDPAVAARLLIANGDRVSFRHPLVRSGILQAATMTQRHAAHAALAATVDEPYLRTWHLAQSIVGPEDAIADELASNVTIPLARGAVITAIRDLERSAQLTSDWGRRGHRLLVAAQHAFGLGRVDQVDRLVTEASRLELDPLDAARAQWLREIFSDGVPGDANRILELCDLAQRAATAGDTDLALNLLLGAALRCWWADAGTVAPARVVETTCGLDVPVDDPRHIAAIAVAEPVHQACQVMAVLDSVNPTSIDDPDALRLYGMAAHAIGDTVRAIDLFDLSAARLREQGRLGLLAHVLGMQVNDLLEVGDWERADDTTAEVLQLSAETGQPGWSTGAVAVDGRAQGLRGDVERGLERASEAELASLGKRLNCYLACAQGARGVSLLAAGRPAEAYDALRRMFDPADPSFHQREGFMGLTFLAEAAVASGRVDEARAVLQDLEQVALVTPSPVLRVHLGYARAVLAADPDVPELLEAALSDDLDRWPFARARLLLATGSWLRRHGRDDEAWRALLEAEASFDRIGAVPWADRARDEIDALTAPVPARRAPGGA